MSIAIATHLADNGRMGRTRYIAWLAVATLLSSAVVAAVFSSLETMAHLGRSLGTNGAFLQNAIIIAIVALGYALVAWASVMRSAATGRAAWVIAIGLLPVLSILLFNGPLFLKKYLPIPMLIEQVLLYGGAGLTIFGLLLGLRGARTD